MNIKNNKRYKVSSEKIETAFLSLLYNSCYEEIKISEICMEAEVNRSTFYAHYDDINDLIIKIERKFANSMSLIFNYGQRQNEEAFVDMFTFVKKNRYFYKAFLNIPYTTLAEANLKKEILSNMKSKNIILEADKVELLYRANFFGAGIKEMIRIWLERDCRESPEEMASILQKEYIKRG